jgi:organic radical activating enzyme
MSAQAVVERIMELVPLNTLVVFSGGEPMLQSEKIAEVCELLYQNGYGEYAIETAGTRPMKPLVEYLRDSQTMHITVSPKLTNSGNPLERRLIWPRLEEYARTGCDFKFVIVSAKDLVEVNSIASRLRLLPGQIWIMPEGTMSGHVIWNGRRLQQAVLDQGWNFTLRQQILLNDNKRGV